MADQPGPPGLRHWDEVSPPMTNRFGTGLATARGVRLALVVVLLLGSGAWRWIKARQVEDRVQAERLCPIRLADLPLQVGNWTGRDAQLDPIISRNSGATDQLYRRYVDERTGVELEIVILYGPAREMYAHDPQFCYPLAGYQPVGRSTVRVVAIPAGDVDPTSAPSRVGIALEPGRASATPPANVLAAPFTASVYTRVGRGETQEVYCGWRLRGEFAASPGMYKTVERLGGMFKIQLARLIRPGELTGNQLPSGAADPGHPIEQFLGEFLPHLQRALDQAGSSPRPRSGSALSSSSPAGLAPPAASVSPTP